MLRMAGQRWWMLRLHLDVKALLGHFYFIILFLGISATCGCLLVDGALDG
jgi:hypothetical protein